MEPILKAELEERVSSRDASYLSMASRLKSGRFIGAATSESARRQLMQPVPCWEKMWVIPESAAPGSTLKVLRWVKTDKKQVRSPPKLRPGCYNHITVIKAI